MTDEQMDDVRRRVEERFAPLFAEAVRNTDREIWRKTLGDFYSPSIHVTAKGNIGIHVGGTVIVTDVETWHRQAEIRQAIGFATDKLRDKFCALQEAEEQEFGGPVTYDGRTGTEMRELCDAIVELLECDDRFHEPVQPKEAVDLPNEPVQTVQLATNKGTWTVNLRGETLQIVDPQGRERHRSKGHLLTGTYFAGALADLPFGSTPEYDEVLKRTAAQFLNPDPNPQPA